MANLKEIRKRIDSVNTTKQITNAMKLVAASKLRKAQTSVVRLRPYASKLRRIMQNVSTAYESKESQAIDNNAFTVQREAHKILLVPVSSNKGLCGPFNSSVTKETIRHIEEEYSTQYNNGNLDIITIGKKVNEFLKSKGYSVKAEYNSLFDDLSYENVSKFALNLIDDFSNKKYDKIILIYNQFKNASTQVLVSEQFLPVLLPESKEAATEIDYIFEPEREILIEKLILQTLQIQFFKVLLNSNASEQGARMVAMHKATENATELVKDLQLFYNKARQAAITREIIEIVSGAEALKGK
ncbi:MAG: ATP synthase F1 subunit gamma [Bacteroidetes bacterium HGW-Bacteroidetes-12]|nr:MAG: ATP synthase F1 subunit gamma [Bacteroidetes bacterium HGW-Bacteroidetes-12]